ncbi:MAG: hypothetical protein SGBAC_005272, partial [Bacillariaceae sp.]
MRIHAAVSLLLAALAAPALAFTPAGHSKVQSASITSLDMSKQQSYWPVYGAAGQPANGGSPAGYGSGFDSSTAASYDIGYKQSARFRKKTKQLATLGPASSDFEMIEKLFLAGADVFRLNFSHGEHAQKQELLDIIRAVEAKHDHPIGVLGDLQGPKLRVGTFANPEGEMLQTGQSFRFDLDPSPGNNQRVMLPHPEIIEASEVGHNLLIDDGKVKVT